MNKLEQIIAELTPEIIAWRRHFHAHPELGDEEYNTSDFVMKKLQHYNIASQSMAQTGVVGTISGQGNKTIALRADMDALPLVEETGVAYASKKHGVMHACGHDAHMAIVLGVAAVLKRLEVIPGNVKFVFQPCEERLPGGAKRMIEEGVLQEPNVDAMLGLHMYPDLPVGVVGVKPGPIMAATDIFTVEIVGQGGHGAAPHTAVDPIVSAASIITSLQTIVSRKIDPVEPAVVTVGMIHAGERPNIIPAKVVFSGTVRSVSAETRLKLQSEINKLITLMAESMGTQAFIKYDAGHGPLVNDAQLTDFVLLSLKEKLGHCAVKLLPYPSMGGEDFASYAEIIPATYMFFGSQAKEVYPWHHPCFDINEEVIPFAVKALVTVILEYLGGNCYDV